MADLSHRARKILQAVVQEYLHTGETVGSRTLTRRYGIDLSPATVRNVMADLEELGLLKQPHTSAGRVPTNDGLRFFIDSLLKVRALSPGEKETIRARYGLPPADMDEALQRTTKLLADMSKQAAIVIAPAPQRSRLEHVEFVRLRDGELLAVLVAEGGQVENRLVRADVGGAFLERVNNYLNELVAGRTLEEVRARVLEELGDEKNAVDELVSQALRLGKAVFTGESASPGVIVAGQANILEPSHAGDPAGVDRIRALLRTLEEKERIVEFLDRTLVADGIQVWLGAETPFADEHLSVVATPYGPGERPVGTIAVIGPTRMNYSKVIPLVDFTAELVSDVLSTKR